MELKELGIRVLEIFIAGIPSIILIITNLLNNLNKIKSQVSSFNTKIKETENSIVLNIDDKVDKLLNTFNDKIEKTIDKVNIVLDDIIKETKNFSSDIEFISRKTEQVFKSNKIALELLSLIVSGNDEMIENGIASILVNKIALSKEEMEKYPELISTDKAYFTKALKEQLFILGRDNLISLINKTLKELNYEEEKKEL